MINVFFMRNCSLNTQIREPVFMKESNWSEISNRCEYTGGRAEERGG